MSGLRAVAYATGLGAIWLAAVAGWAMLNDKPIGGSVLVGLALIVGLVLVAVLISAGSKES